MRWMKRWRKRLHALVHTEAVDRELDEELAFHLEMETEKYVRAGWSAEAARRQARLAFGAVRQHRAEARDARWLSWMPALSLDFKLGARMLVKYPGLTLVGGLAMAFAIWIGAVTFELVTLLAFPTLPLPGGDRIVQIRLWDAAASRAEPRAMHDFVVWREALRSVTDLGAYRDVTRNLVADDGDARPVEVAEISASAFGIASGRPLLGRALVESDERAGAPPVVVLGYDLWRSRFAGEAGIVGRTVRLGESFATVVGVMPQGFAFPVSHELWTPLRADVLIQEPRDGPGITVFGRLAPRATLDVAQAELATLGRRAAAESPNTHAHLQPQVASYATQFMAPSIEDRALFLAIPAFAVMLLVLVCGNVALLLFARAATRETELVVRSALGASRGRIILQLFAEALVLGGVAAVVGLVAAHLALQRWGHQYLEVNLGRLPFWFDPQLSLGTVLYVGGLTLLGAAIAGVLPALKVTDGLGTRLREGTAGGGRRFGGLWTAVIVTQIAVTAAFPALAVVEQWELLRIRSADVGFRSEQYVAMQLELDAAVGPGADTGAARAAHRIRYGATLEELRRRVAAEPDVAGITFVDRLPHMYHPERRIEVQDASAVAGPDGAALSAVPRDSLPEASIALIDPTYFDVLQAPILAGRGFNNGDVAHAAPVAIVDRSFVEQVLRGRNPIGRRVRFAAMQNAADGEADEPHPWFEIVGVVKDLGMTHPSHRSRAAGIYLPGGLESNNPFYMVVHARGDPMALVPQVRAIAAAVDPTLRLSEIQRVDQLTDGVLWFLGLWLRITLLLTAIALLLSLSGIYAVMSFTVARRTREIGIRVALGANARTVIASIFRRPLAQVGVGVGAGTLLAGLMFLAGRHATVGAHFTVSARGVALLALYAALILGVCLLACVAPTRRALAVQPMEALRVE